MLVGHFEYILRFQVVNTYHLLCLGCCDSQNWIAEVFWADIGKALEWLASGKILAQPVRGVIGRIVQLPKGKIPITKGQIHLVYRDR